MTSQEIDIEVGKRLHAMRCRRKMSQTALGKASGVSFQQIQKYECGSNRISVSLLVRIAVALEVSPVHFLEGLDG